MKMEDDAEQPGQVGPLHGASQQQPQQVSGTGGQPSDSEIEQVIKSAMALAGKSVGSRSGTPGREDVGYLPPPAPHPQQQQGMGPRMLPTQSKYEHYPQFMHPSHGQMAMGPAPSMFHQLPKPVSLPLFSESLARPRFPWR